MNAVTFFILMVGGGNVKWMGSHYFVLQISPYYYGINYGCICIHSAIILSSAQNSVGYICL